MHKQYADSLGAALERCTKDETVIYRVTGSGGYTGVTYYYDEEGGQLGREKFSDTPGAWPFLQPLRRLWGWVIRERRPPDVREFDCRRIDEEVAVRGTG